MTDAERTTALVAVAAEVRSCTRCRLHETRTKAVPGEGDPETEVVFVGEGPGFNEDREGRPFVGRAGELLERHLASIGWQRSDVFITNVVKCRPPNNRDPEPDEIAACSPYLRRQLEILDPALLVTLGRHSMGRFMPDARISRDHGTLRAVDPATGARDALVFPMFHPAAALRSPDVARQSEADIRAVPAALLEARGRRAAHASEAPSEAPSDASLQEHAGGTLPQAGPTLVAVMADVTVPELESAPEPEPSVVAVGARAFQPAESVAATDSSDRSGQTAEPSDPSDQLTLF